MSSNHKRYRHNIDNNNMYIDEYCRDYYQYDKRARKESKERINEHLVERRTGIKRCVDSAVEDAYALNVSFRNDRPQFMDKDDIIESAANETKHQINNWDGVQLKQCKEIIDSYEAFAKKAKNHQDQTSWKISGNFFFAPYIKKAKNFLLHFTHFIDGINEETRAEIQRLLYLSFAKALFTTKIKFKRTKLKPLLRHRTLVKSEGIHRELKALHSSLIVATFIDSARDKRMQLEGKSNIIAADLFETFTSFVNKQYLRQKQKVYALLNMTTNNDDCDELNINEMDASTNSDIDDEDYIVTEEDDIDINISEYSDTASVISPIAPYKRRKYSYKQRAFQSILINSRSVVDKQHILQQQRKEHRRKRVDNLCASAMNKHSLPYLSDINTANVENKCSDCVESETTNNSLSFHDDRSFASSSTPSISISPHYHPSSQPIKEQRYRPFKYYPAAPHSVRVPAASPRMMVQMIRRENEFLRRELSKMRYILEEKRRFFHFQQMRYYQMQDAAASRAVEEPQLAQYTAYNNRIPPAINECINNKEGERSMLNDENMTHSTFASANHEALNVENMIETTSLRMDAINESMQFVADPNALSPEPFFNIPSNLNLDSVFSQNHLK